MSVSLQGVFKVDQLVQIGEVIKGQHGAHLDEAGPAPQDRAPEQHIVGEVRGRCPDQALGPAGIRFVALDAAAMPAAKKSPNCTRSTKAATLKASMRLFAK